MVEPIFDLWSTYAPSPFILKCRNNITENRKIWDHFPAENGKASINELFTLNHTKIVEMPIPTIVFNTFKDKVRDVKFNWSIESTNLHRIASSTMKISDKGRKNDVEHQGLELPKRRKSAISTLESNINARRRSSVSVPPILPNVK